MYDIYNLNVLLTLYSYKIIVHQINTKMEYLTREIVVLYVI